MKQSLLITLLCLVFLVISPELALNVKQAGLHVPPSNPCSADGGAARPCKHPRRKPAGQGDVRESWPASRGQPVTNPGF